MCTRHLSKMLVWVPLITMLSAATGCVGVGWLAQGMVGQGGSTVRVTAEYTGLAHESVAVLVNAGPRILATYPSARRTITSAVSELIAEHVPGVEVLDARKVIKFQRRHMYWNTITYQELAERLDVTRLVLIDLAEFRMHAPGNRYVWRGRITANLAVAKVEGANPDALSYATTVHVEYPADRSVGMMRAKAKSIRSITVTRFARRAAGKFYEHMERRSS